jgi:NAD(P)-dependent dehydrogenase (short-subunit alcohol dehydrogenase family)
VALFVGGTSGIGKQAAIKLASVTARPTITIVGRNEEAGAQVVNELKAANPNGTYAFKQADVSNLRNVDTICEEVKSESRKLDVLFLSSGTIAFSKQGEKRPRVNDVIKYAQHTLTARIQKPNQRSTPITSSDTIAACDSSII